MTNAFAFDYTNREFDDEDANDSEKWREPGSGRSVSPDDMFLFWDRPTTAGDRSMAYTARRSGWCFATT